MICALSVFQIGMAAQSAEAGLEAAKEGEMSCCAAPSRLSVLTRDLTAAEIGADAANLADRPKGMVWIPGGQFTMGSDRADAYRPEQPAHKVKVSGFWMDETEVTNAQFKQFVEATGYVTTAEKAPALEEIMAQLPPGTPPPPAEALVASSLVLHPPGMLYP